MGFQNNVKNVIEKNTHLNLRTINQIQLFTIFGVLCGSGALTKRALNISIMAVEELVFAKNGNRLNLFQTI